MRLRPHILGLTLAVLCIAQATPAQAINLHSCVATFREWLRTASGMDWVDYRPVMTESNTLPPHDASIVFVGLRGADRGLSTVREKTSYALGRELKHEGIVHAEWGAGTMTPKEYLDWVWSGRSYKQKFENADYAGQTPVPIPADGFRGYKVFVVELHRPESGSRDQLWSIYRDHLAEIARNGEYMESTIFLRDNQQVSQAVARKHLRDHFEIEADRVTR